MVNSNSLLCCQQARNLLWCGGLGYCWQSLWMNLRGMLLFPLDTQVTFLNCKNICKKIWMSCRPWQLIFPWLILQRQTRLRLVLYLHPKHLPRGLSEFCLNYNVQFQSFHLQPLLQNRRDASHWGSNEVVRVIVDRDRLFGKALQAFLSLCIRFKEKALFIQFQVDLN